MSIKAGDVVILKSGGPSMTAEQIGWGNNPNKVLCSWFDGAELKTGDFILAALKKKS